MAAFMLCHEVPLQTGDHQQTYQCSGEAAVIQAHTAMEHRNCGDHTEVHYGSAHAVEPAVFVSDGAEAVGIAQANHNGLGMEILGEFGTKEGRKKLENVGGDGVTQHNGPDIERMGSGIACGQHAEDDTEGNAVKGGADDIVV